MTDMWFGTHLHYHSIYKDHCNSSLACLAVWVILNNSWCRWLVIAVYLQKETSHQQILQDIDYEAVAAHDLMESGGGKKVFSH